MCDPDAGKSPRQIDIVRGRVQQVGIYESEADQLMVCFEPMDDRPTDFKTKPRTDHSSFFPKRKITP